MLPAIEFAVNNTPNRTTGYSAFYLNYGFHPLHPLQLLHSPEETRNEAVVQFTSRMQSDFQAAGQQLNQARQQMMQQTDSSRRSLEFQEGDLVLLSTKHIRFRQCPTKLQRRFVGPFQNHTKGEQCSIQIEVTRELVNASCVSHFVTEKLA